MGASLVADNELVQSAAELRVTAPGAPRSAEQRREPRRVCQGDVRLTIDGDGIVIAGQLLDVSAHGFRAFYDAEELPQDTIVRFEHIFFRGRARVAWSTSVNGRVQSGFQILL